MKTKCAVLREAPGSWDVVDVDLEEPRAREVTVRMVGSGLCHSEVSMTSGDFPVASFPICGGHEGAGVVVDVGPECGDWKVGDHAAISAVPSCGRCHWCSNGMGNLCDLSADLLTGARFGDPTSFRMHEHGHDVAQFCGVGCFTEYTTISIDQAIHVPEDVPLETICLLGCAVDTGWGSAVNLARPEPGHTVIVMGVGGVGAFAVQGAVHAGATNVIACDPIGWKRESAGKIGATHMAASLDEATDIAHGLTNGQGADSTIVTVGRMEVDYVAPALASIRKAGTVVIAGLGDAADTTPVPMSLFDLSLGQKRLQGSMYGATAPFRDVPMFVRMYQQGQLKLDEVVTRTYTLDQVNEGYADLMNGETWRGVITFD